MKYQTRLGVFEHHTRDAECSSVCRIGFSSSARFSESKKIVSRLVIVDGRLASAESLTLLWERGEVGYLAQFKVYHGKW